MDSPLVNKLLARGLIPIVNHENRFYRAFEAEASLRINLLAKTDGFLCFLKSEKPNAYHLREDGKEIIAFSESLLSLLEKKISTLLASDHIRQFFQEVFHVTYTCCSDESSIFVGHTDKYFDQIPPDGDSLYFKILRCAVDGAVAFVMLHEISHMLGDYEYDKDDVVHKVSQMTWKEQLGPLYEERRADQESSWWLSNRINDFLAEYFDGQVAAPLVVWHYSLAYFGALVAVIFTSTSSEFSDDVCIDHPTYETRLEGVWESLSSFLEQKHEFLLANGVTHAIHLLRQAIELELFNKRSKYAFTVDEVLRGKDI